MRLNVFTDWRIGVGDQLKFVYNSLHKLNSGKYTEIDFAGFSFCPPILSVAHAAFLEQYYEIIFVNVRPGSYHEYIEFPNGFKPDQFGNWSSTLDKYRNKNYLPLINFSTSRNTKITRDRNNVISQSLNVINEITRLPDNYLYGIRYLISELIENIVDHSEAKRGWFSFQNYPSHGFIDFCIADSGVGILYSYKNYKGSQIYKEIDDHIEALNSAIQGKSTKNEKERGFGIHTSKNMLTNGLHGKFVILSGNALLVNEQLIDFKTTFQGTLAFLRIPIKKIDKDFYYINYVE